MTQKMVTPYITAEQLDRVFSVKPTHEKEFLLDHIDAVTNSVYAYRYSNVARCHIDLIRQLSSQQAKIDALMLEFCPQEMTPNQIDNWAANQQRVSPEKEAAIDKTLGITK